MNEDFIPFEIAKKLNEKGFNIETAHHYNDFGQICVSLCDEEYPYPCPEIHQVLKWLREENKMHLIIPASFDEGYWWEVRDFNREISEYSDAEYKSYEETALAGIEYVLYNLI